MSNHERTGVRDLVYSRWHRRANLQGHLQMLPELRQARAAMIAADSCTMIDVDALEYCKRCAEPLALIETKHHLATTKSTRVLVALARRALIKAYLVEYWTDDEGEISKFRVSERYPNGPTVVLTPVQYAAFLLDIHRLPHDCMAEAVA